MTREQVDLIRYRLGRAFETLEEVTLLLNSGYANSAMNRLYYACFYAVTALLATEKQTSSKHSGVRALFNQNWVKPGLISREMGELYGLLFDRRQKGDYADFIRFQVSEVEPLIEQAKNFITDIKRVTEDFLARGK